jgi:membrane associated rhomboid family serine protease
MEQAMYQRNISIRFGGPLTQGVKLLMIINFSVFIIQQIAGLFEPNMLEVFLGISHNGFVSNLMLWQPFTYMFLHGGWFHIFFNLLALWMFGGDLESIWGKRKFLQYYIFSGIGAGLFIALMNYYVALSRGEFSVTIGASGAIYSLLLAYGLTWPNREVLLYFLFPIKIKYLLIAFGLMEFFGTLSTAGGSGGNISHIGHLGGLLAGFLLYKFFQKKSFKSSGASFFEKFMKKRRIEKKKKEIEVRIEAKQIIDETLDKIAKHGMASLSEEEKKRLEWARRNYYRSGNETIH